MTNPSSPFAFVRRFNPVVTRDRHDGWTPERQEQFIAGLAESGCVADACRRVGVSRESAYALRRRYDATDFRAAWDAALDYAVQQLSDAALSRAIHGVAVPHYYKGEVVGEHRRFNESLTMFILRYRDPVRYARHWDRQAVVRGHPEEMAEGLAIGLNAIATDETRETQDFENEVLRDAAEWASDAEVRDLCETQLIRGVAAAVKSALKLREKYEGAWQQDEAEAAAAATAPLEAPRATPEAEAEAAGPVDSGARGDAFRFDVASELSTSAPFDPLDYRNYSDPPAAIAGTGPAAPAEHAASGPSWRAVVVPQHRWEPGRPPWCPGGL